MNKIKNPMCFGDTQNPPSSGLECCLLQEWLSLEKKFKSICRFHIQFFVDFTTNISTSTTEFLLAPPLSFLGSLFYGSGLTKAIPLSLDLSASYICTPNHYWYQPPNKIICTLYTVQWRKTGCTLQRGIHCKAYYLKLFKTCILE